MEGSWIRSTSRFWLWWSLMSASILGPDFMMFNCSMRRLVSNIEGVGSCGGRALSVTSWVFAAAVEASGSDPWGASLPFVLARTMSASWCFLARPCQVSEPLASEASLFLDLAAFNAADISLSDQKAIVKDAFGSFRGVEPDTQAMRTSLDTLSFLLSHATSSIWKPCSG